jgi:hypothetical protein
LIIVVIAVSLALPQEETEMEGEGPKIGALGQVRYLEYDLHEYDFHGKT